MISNAEFDSNVYPYQGPQNHHLLYEMMPHVPVPSVLTDGQGPRQPKPVNVSSSRPWTSSLRLLR